MFEFNREPDFVNDLGTKWWRDEYITALAKKEDRNQVSLNAVCFLVETKDGYRTRCLISEETNEIIEEDQSLEGMGIKIEVRKFLISDHLKHPSVCLHAKEN